MERRREEENLLDKYLLKLCNKERFLEIIYYFTLLMEGKKLCRPHQYFAVKAAQESVKNTKVELFGILREAGKA